METTKKLASTGVVARTYWNQTKQHWFLFVLLIIGNLGIQLADLASPWFLRKFFNLLATHTPSEALVHTITLLVLTVAAITFGGWLARRLQSQSIMHLELRVMADLYRAAFTYLLRHSHNFFTSNFAGSLTSKVGKYARAYEALVDALFLEFFPTAVFVIGAILILSLQHPLLGTVLAVWSVLFTGFQIVMARRRLPWRAERSAAETATTGALADAISNQSTVALFAGTEHEAKRFITIVDRWKQATKVVWFGDDRIWATMGLMVISINAILLYIAGMLWARGLMTIGDIVLLQAYLLGTFERLFSINRTLRRFYDTLADAQEMVAILEEPHEVTDVPGAPKLKVATGLIDFKNVEFFFHTEKGVLHNFNLTIAGAQKVALVGPSGAGKSTITKLLLRFFDVKGGSIEIDGQNIATVTQDSLREAISFVPQEPILFHRTLMENIRYGRLDATDEEVITAAKKAHCHEFIAALPQGYETFVGERGIKLSGGERQRVAIARAILKDSPILVLDEATSSLDSESESLIQEALAVLMEGKTVIVIAHRLSTIMKMDRIVVLQNGAVVADGTHDELLAQGGLYQKLWNIQAGSFLDDDEHVFAKVED